MDTAILTNSLNQFLTTFNAAYGLIWVNGGQALLWMLAGIELVLAALWWAWGGAQMLEAIKKILFLMFWLWIVTNFAWLAPVFVYSLVDAGISGAGGAAGGHGIILDPSRIFAAGVEAITPIMTLIEDMDDWDQLGQVLMLWVSALIILLAFAVVAIQIFLTVLEFYLFLGLSAILLPFGINRYTKFIAEKTLGGVVNYGVRMMVLAFILDVTEPTLTGSIHLTITDGMVEWNEIFSVMVIAWAIALLSWNAPGVAAGLVAGSPSLSAGTATQNSVAGTAAGSALAGAAVGATRAASGAAVRLAGNATAGYQRGSAFTHGSRGQKVVGGIAGATESLVRSSTQCASRAVSSHWQRGKAGSDRAMTGTALPTSGSSASQSRPDWASRLLSAGRHTPHEAHPSGGIQARL